jgi:hypothetical protein
MNGSSELVILGACVMTVIGALIIMSWMES